MYWYVSGNTHTNNEEVHQSVYMCALEHCLAAVLHEFSVFTSKDNQSITPLGVSQNTSSKNNFIIIQRMFLSLECQDPFKLTQSVIRRFTYNFTYKNI